MLGSTVPVRKGLHNCFYYGDLWGCECIQVYSTLSRRWDIPISPDEGVIAKFKSAYEHSNVKQVISHIPFLVNLCSQDVELQKKSERRLQIELNYNNQLGIKYTVLHPGSNKNKTESLKLIAQRMDEAIDSLNYKNQCMILLETMSGQGNYLGDLEDIATIIGYVSHTNMIGVCVDTAHIYQNGYDINANYEPVIQCINKVIGLSYVKVIHLNDSLSKLNSHADRHSFIGEGFIELETFRKIVNDRRFSELPMILELPDIFRTPDALYALRSLQR